jgi:hypothetical protein
MRAALIAPIILGLALSGCGKADEKTAEKKVSSETIKREAGSWKNDITIAKFEMPGAPPETKTMMEGLFQAASGMEVCLTPEQVAKEDMATELAKGGAAKDCTFSKKEVTGGVINIIGVCKDGSGESVDMTITGTAAPANTQANILVSGKTPTKQTFTMGINVASKRTGDCKPGQITADGKKV